MAVAGFVRLVGVDVSAHNIGDRGIGICDIFRTEHHAHKRAVHKSACVSSMAQEFAWLAGVCARTHFWVPSVSSTVHHWSSVESDLDLTLSSVTFDF